VGGEAGRTPAVPHADGVRSWVPSYVDYPHVDYPHVDCRRSTTAPHVDRRNSHHLL